MNRTRLSIAAGFAVTAVLGADPVHAQSDDKIDLVVSAGRPLRVALDDTSAVHRVGQPVKATLIEPVYAYDRIVLPVGTPVSGYVAALRNPPKAARARAMITGDFSPHRIIEVRFDRIMLNGEAVPIETVAQGSGIPHVSRQVAPDSDQEAAGAAARAKQEAKSRVSEAAAAVKSKITGTVAAVKAPGKGARLKRWAIDQLPYHPQYLLQSSVYDAELQSPLSFGTIEPHALAPEGTTPAPGSILDAQLGTTLDSSTSARGTPLAAVVTAPVFAEDGRLIFPAGTTLSGEVTYAQHARRFHRNGQLRFLFERVERPNQESAPLLASLHAVDVNTNDRVVLDEEGGAAVTNSKARFVTPALALLAMRASVEHGEGRGFDSGTAGVEARTSGATINSGNIAGRALGGFIGLGLLGVVVGQASRPLGLAISMYGLARSLYGNVLGKGQELHFQADTPIQVQLAPARPRTP